MNPRIPLLRARVLTLAAFLPLVGCTHTYEVKVDSLSKPRAGEVASYKIRHAEQSPVDLTLRQKEAEDFVKTALSSKGLYEAPNFEKADVILDVNYGMEPPRVRYERSTVPVFAQVGGGVRFEQAIVGRDVRGNPVFGMIAVREPPRTELVGYQELTTPQVVYEKYLEIVARENKPAAEGRPAQEIWSVHVTSEDDSKDLRKYLPVLASATIDYIGRNTDSEQTVKLREDAQVLAFVKKGM